MGCWKANAKRQFDGWSASYDHSILQRLVFRPAHQRLLEALQVPACARVLDVGCGTGRFARRLLRRNPTTTLVGVDLSVRMLEHAAKNCAELADRILLVPGDSEQLPFGDQTFDIVTCIHSFHHYPDQPQVIREMHRVLKPGGQALIIDGDRDRCWGWLLFDWVVTTIEGAVSHCSARRFRDLLAKAGFEKIEHVRCGWLVPFLLIRAVVPQATGQVRLAA